MSKEKAKKLKTFLDKEFETNSGFIALEALNDKLYLYVDNKRLYNEIAEPFKEIIGIDVICAKRNKKYKRQ